ncbi:Fic family protein [Listeria monocytogenes]|uniref:Fic family protein n=1 Tax=Listeria monocytogenes TaxID=1639 RepID=UPI0039A55196
MNTNPRFPKEYLQDVLVRLAHHSSAIEGNTISLADTVSIILHNKVTGKESYDLREIYEVKNHEQAFAYVMEEIEALRPISVPTIKQIHAYLTDRLQYDHGEFKTSANAILGADFQTASPQETPILVQQWVDNVNYRLGTHEESLEKEPSKDDKLETILESHIDFERIHPFSDGNGRTGRMVMNYLLMENDFPPLIIKAEEKAVYMTYLANQDVSGFHTFAQQKLAQEKERVDQFRSTEKEQIQLPKKQKDDLER